MRRHDRAALFPDRLSNGRYCEVALLAARGARVRIEPVSGVEVTGRPCTGRDGRPGRVRDGGHDPRRRGEAAALGEMSQVRHLRVLQVRRVEAVEGDQHHMLSGRRGCRAGLAAAQSCHGDTGDGQHREGTGSDAHRSDSCTSAETPGEPDGPTVTSVVSGVNPLRSACKESRSLPRRVTGSATPDVHRTPWRFLAQARPRVAIPLKASTGPGHPCGLVGWVQEGDRRRVGVWRWWNQRSGRAANSAV